MLEKLARCIACKHCENPSRVFELELQASEQATEIIRLNYVLDQVKKEREAALAMADLWRGRYEEERGS